MHSLYGYDLAVEGKLSLRDLTESAACMRVVARKMDKTADRFGRPSHFGAFVLHLADALDADIYSFDQDGPGTGNYGECEYIKHEPADLVSWVELMLRNWKRDNGIEVA